MIAQFRCAIASPGLTCRMPTFDRLALNASPVRLNDVRGHIGTVLTVRLGDQVARVVPHVLDVVSTPSTGVVDLCFQLGGVGAYLRGALDQSVRTRPWGLLQGLISCGRSGFLTGGRPGGRRVWRGAAFAFSALVGSGGLRVMPLAEIPQGCSSNFPTLVAVSA